MAKFLSPFLAFVAFSVTNAAVIVPGATWTDTSGNVIQAHGGGFLKVRLDVDNARLRSNIIL